MISNTRLSELIYPLADTYIGYCKNIIGICEGVEIQPEDMKFLLSKYDLLPVHLILYDDETEEYYEILMSDVSVFETKPATIYPGTILERDVTTCRMGIGVSLYTIDSKDVAYNKFRWAIHFHERFANQLDGMNNMWDLLPLPNPINTTMKPEFLALYYNIQSFLNQVEIFFYLLIKHSSIELDEKNKFLVENAALNSYRLFLNLFSDDLMFATNRLNFDTVIHSVFSSIIDFKQKPSTTEKNNMEPHPLGKSRNQYSIVDYSDETNLPTIYILNFGCYFEN